MAYKKRRYNTKKNKTKRFNKYVYAKTDSRNQAKQIVRLNKKITRVYNTLRPEIIRINNNGQVNTGVTMVSSISFDTLINKTSILETFKGNYAKFIYFNFRLFCNPVSVDITKGKSFRIVILQNRYPIAEAPSPTDILEISANTFGVFSPFKDDIHLKYKILISKVFSLSSDKDYLYRSFNFKKLISYKKTSGDESKYQRGCIFVIIYSPQGEEAGIMFNWTSKFGYVDTLN